MSNYGTCPYCGDAGAKTTQWESGVYTECPVCGNFVCKATDIRFGAKFKDEKATFLYYHNPKRFPMRSSAVYYYLIEEDVYKRECKEPENLPLLSEEEVMAFYPKSFAERIDLILLGLASQSKFFGDAVSLTSQEVRSAWFVKRCDESGEFLKHEQIVNQVRGIHSYLKDQGYIKTVETTKGVQIQLTAEGWKRVDELQKNSAENSNTVFVAMSFKKEMEETRETMKKAIVDCGFEPRIMDEIEHNHQIVPEMLYEIRQARFIIAELSGHNNGAYYEAGYALGLGKEVIHVCSKKKFGRVGHFDVKQVNTVLWEDQDDLYKRLVARIKATIR